MKLIIKVTDTRRNMTTLRDETEVVAEADVEFTRGLTAAFLRALANEIDAPVHGQPRD